MDRLCRDELGVVFSFLDLHSHVMLARVSWELAVASGLPLSQTSRNTNPRQTMRHAWHKGLPQRVVENPRTTGRPLDFMATCRGGWIQQLRIARSTYNRPDHAYALQCQNTIYSLDLCADNDMHVKSLVVSAEYTRGEDTSRLLREIDGRLVKRPDFLIFNNHLFSGRSWCMTKCPRTVSLRQCESPNWRQTLQTLANGGMRKLQLRGSNLIILNSLPRLDSLHISFSAGRSMTLAAAYAILGAKLLALYIVSAKTCPAEVLQKLCASPTLHAVYTCSPHTPHTPTRNPRRIAFRHARG